MKIVVFYACWKKKSAIYTDLYFHLSPHTYISLFHSLTYRCIHSLMFIRILTLIYLSIFVTVKYNNMELTVRRRIIETGHYPCRLVEVIRHVRGVGLCLSISKQARKLILCEGVK